MPMLLKHDAMECCNRGLGWNCSKEQIQLELARFESLLVDDVGDLGRGEYEVGRIVLPYLQEE